MICVLERWSSTYGCHFLQSPLEPCDLEPRCRHIDQRDLPGRQRCSPRWHHHRIRKTAEVSGTGWTTFDEPLAYDSLCKNWVSI